MWFFYNQVSKEYAPFNCHSWNCEVCGPKRARKLVKSISKWARKKGLDRFLTLTLQPSKLPDYARSPYQSYYYMMYVWRKFRVYLYRRYGRISYVWVVEPHKSGFCHIHILIDRFIPQRWISSVFSRLGGGKIVHIERVKKMRDVSSYVGKYMGKMHKKPIPRHKRRYSSSRDIHLMEKPDNDEWVLVRYCYDTLNAILKKKSTGEYPDLISSKVEPPPWAKEENKG